MILDRMAAALLQANHLLKPRLGALLWSVSLNVVINMCAGAWALEPPIIMDNPVSRGYLRKMLVKEKKDMVPIGTFPRVWGLDTRDTRHRQLGG